jgi:hypothetical protein
LVIKKICPCDIGDPSVTVASKVLKELSFAVVMGTEAERQERMPVRSVFAVA